MSAALPTRLKSEPLVEVVCEVRFESANDAAVGLLPGLFYEKLEGFERLNKLPLSELPAEIYSTDALKYKPHLQMPRANEVIQVGPRVVSLSMRSPYPGWKSFKARVMEVISILKGQKFISEFEWLSLKYVDMLELGDDPSLEWLNASVHIGGISLTTEPHTVRVEFGADPWRTVVHIAGPANILDPPKSGMVVDVDTIYKYKFDDFWNEYEGVLDQLHAANKEKFFSLLKDETLKKLGPEY